MGQLLLKNFIKCFILKYVQIERLQKLYEEFLCTPLSASLVINLTRNHSSNDRNQEISRYNTVNSATHIIQLSLIVPLTFLLATPHGMRDLSSPTRDRTRTPSTGRQSLNHWTAREVPGLFSIAHFFWMIPVSSPHY